MTPTYNGWANRETWVYNLHFGDCLLSELLELAEDGYFDDADNLEAIKDYIEAYSENNLEAVMDQLSGPLACFFSDLMDETLIDHHEIMEHMVDDILERLLEIIEEEDLRGDDLPCWFDSYCEQRGWDNTRAA